MRTKQLIGLALISAGIGSVGYMGFQIVGWLFIVDMVVAAAIAAAIVVGVMLL